MGWVLLIHIGLPLVFGLAFVFFRTACSPHPPTWDIAIEAALDFAILGIGTTGAIFENPKIAAAFGEHSSGVGIAVVGIDFLLTSLIVLIRRYVFAPTEWKLLWTVISINLGALALSSTSGVLVYCYSAAPSTSVPIGAWQLVRLVATVVAAASVTGISLGLLVKLIVQYTPAATRIASDPRLIHTISRAIEDIDCGNTVTLDDLLVKVRKRTATR